MMAAVVTLDSITFEVPATLTKEEIGVNRIGKTRFKNPANPLIPTIQVQTNKKNTARLSAGRWAARRVRVATSGVDEGLSRFGDLKPPQVCAFPRTTVQWESVLVFHEP